MTPSVRGNRFDILDFCSTETVVVFEVPGNGQPVNIFRGIAYDVLESYVLAAEDNPEFFAWCDELGRPEDSPGAALEFMTEHLQAMWVYHPEDPELTQFLLNLPQPMGGAYPS